MEMDHIKAPRTIDKAGSQMFLGKTVRPISTNFFTFSRFLHPLFRTRFGKGVNPLTETSLTSRVLRQPITWKPVFFRVHDEAFPFRN
jgi:hypothetical protein